MAAAEGMFEHGFNKSSGAERSVIGRLLDDESEAGVQELDAIHAQASSSTAAEGRDFGQYVLGMAARIETDAYLDPNQYDLPEQDAETVWDVEAIWRDIDQAFAAFARVRGNHQTADIISQ